MKYAKIEDGTVSNLVEADEVFADEHGLVLAPRNVDIGFLYDGENFSRPAVDLEALLEDFRAERKRRLEETDWMALSDTGLTPEWETYRQALRDITEQSGFPQNITWPMRP